MFAFDYDRFFSIFFNVWQDFDFGQKWFSILTIGQKNIFRDLLCPFWSNKFENDRYCSTDLLKIVQNRFNATVENFRSIVENCKM